MECQQGGAKTALGELRGLQENQLHLGFNLCPAALHTQGLNPLLRATVSQGQRPKALQKSSPLATTSVLCLCCCLTVVQSLQPKDAPCMCWCPVCPHLAGKQDLHWEQQHCSQLLSHHLSSGTALQSLILSQHSSHEMSLLVQKRLISQGFWTTG